ncbi:MAG TPA: NADH-quinone oxidoreductase subunit H [Pirellulales bacterium]|nr:NADH-quinone oxidoreductase subunit H [Pirellulales bacterium]
MINFLLHILLVLALPPLLPGVINKTKAFFAGRTGPPLAQVYYDLWKLVQKGSVFSETTTWVFKFGPVIGLATALLAAMIVPLGEHDAPLSFTGDLVLFAYLLGLGRFFTVLAALDTGSAFEGMGSAREATYACLAEPVLFFGLLVLAKISGSLRLAGMLDTSLEAQWGTAGAGMLLILASWFVLLLVENCRIPFDDPNTHLELTMIHEVMVLDHSGPALSLIVYGAAIKLFVFAALIVQLSVPLVTGIGVVDWVVFVAGVLAVAVVVGVVESGMARLRLVSLPHLLIAAVVLSALGLVLIIAYA